MAIDTEKYQLLKKYCAEHEATLIAVSKTKPVSDIEELYALGQLDYGENYVQELVDKQPVLPQNIRWHFIGHLQSNKVKYIAPFVHLIHGVDSFKLLKEINKQGAKNNRVIEVLLQVFIANEETKFGLDKQELNDLLHDENLPSLENVRIKGLMGMASFSDDEALVRSEFQNLKALYDKAKELDMPNVNMEILSMGMSGDYEWAIGEGSNMIRIGSLLFGKRG